MLIKNLPEWTFRNNSGLEIPPYACMEITAVEASGPDIVFVVGRPTAAKIAYGDAASFLFNGGEYVPAAARGVGYFPCPRVFALVDTGAGLSVAEYDEWAAPVADQWYLGEGWIFQLQTASDPVGVHVEGSAATRLVGLRTQSSFRVRTSGAVSAAGGGSATMYKFNGSNGYSATAVTRSVKSFVGDVATNKDCLAVVVNNSLAIIEVC